MDMKISANGVSESGGSAKMKYQAMAWRGKISGGNGGRHRGETWRAKQRGNNNGVAHHGESKQTCKHRSSRGVAPAGGRRNVWAEASGVWAS